MPENITTAVDSLVKMVNEKGRVSIDDASRELGIPGNILNEWASFLDEEKIIHIVYKFTTPYLITVKATRQETQNKNKINRDTIDLVIRRLSVTLNFITKSNPSTERQKQQKDFLMKKISEFIESARRGKISKEELQKLVKYYKVYKNSI